MTKDELIAVKKQLEDILELVDAALEDTNDLRNTNIHNERMCSMGLARRIESETKAIFE